MAMEAATLVTSPSANTIGNAFVEQYYRILHEKPEMVFHFYLDSSVISRPSPDGLMSSVSTLKAIDKKILSLNYTNYKTEIKTADAQNSHMEGVLVLVTGCLIGKDDSRRKFTQSFFLAPQEHGGYFVLNDILRYVDENDSLESNPVLVNGAPESILSMPVTPDPEPLHVPDRPEVDHTTSIAEAPLSNGEAVHEPSDVEDGPVVVEEAVTVPVNSAQNDVHSVIEPRSSVQEDAPKKSYASIVKHKGTKVPSVVYVPTNAGKPSNAAKAPTNAGTVAAATAEQQAVGTGPVAPGPAPESSAPTSNNAPEISIQPEEVEGYSIYIRNLPLNATVRQVEEEFKRFGAIGQGGVQVRSNKGFCFGFVEFEKSSSMHDALKASPVMLGNRAVHVEEKKTTTRVNSINGRVVRSSPGRGGFRNDNFRNDNFRGRGNFVGGRGYGRNEGYGRNDYGNRGDFSGRRGPARNGEDYQRANHNGNGRVVRQGGTNQAIVSE